MPLQLIPTITFSDVALVDWLADVLDATITERTPSDDGGLAHAQLWIGDQCLMASTTTTLTRPLGGSSVYLALDADAELQRLWERAIRGGAEVVMAPTPMSYGGSNATFRDRDGNFWSLGTYVPSAPNPEPASPAPRAS